jgi:hypothetical protein
MIVARPEPTIIASSPAIVKTFPSLLVKVWKYFISLSIVFVVQLSTSHISSSIELTPVQTSIGGGQGASPCSWFSADSKPASRAGADNVLKEIWFGRMILVLISDEQ